MKPHITPEADGSLRCPRCGSREFQPVRSTGVKVGLGLLSLATQPRELRCIACGMRYTTRPPVVTPEHATPPRPD